MGKSTISTGPCSIAKRQITRGYRPRIPFQFYQKPSFPVCKPWLTSWFFPGKFLTATPWNENYPPVINCGLLKNPPFGFSSMIFPAGTINPHKKSGISPLTTSQTESCSSRWAVFTSANCRVCRNVSVKKQSCAALAPMTRKISLAEGRCDKTCSRPGGKYLKTPSWKILKFTNLADL